MRLAPLCALFCVFATAIACGSGNTGRRGDPTLVPPGLTTQPAPEQDPSEPPAEQAGPPTGNFPALPPPPEEPTPALGSGIRASLLDWSKTLDNAALRDRELEGLVRGYLMLARQLFVQFRAAKSGAGQQGSYDPMPAWRFQARVAPQLIALSSRAALLGEHLEKLRGQVGAEAVRVDLGERTAMLPSPGNRAQQERHDRASMIALYRALCDCVRDDTWHRAQHGAGLIRRQRAGGADLERPERAELLRREVAMLRTTMRCTSIAGRRRPMRDD